MNENPNEPPPKPRADWMAWSLQLLFGLVVGSCGGWLIWGHLLDLRFVTIDQWPGIISGVALFVGALASRRGDRMWFRSSVFDSEPPAQSPASKAASFVIGSYGVLLFCLTLFSHLPRTESRSGSSIFVLLLIGGFIAFLVIHALRTDTAYSRYGAIDREESPLAFWLYVAFGTLSVLYILVTLL
jgi:hypothetical protein